MGGGGGGVIVDSIMMMGGGSSSGGVISSDLWVGSHRGSYGSTHWSLLLTAVVMSVVTVRVRHQSEVVIVVPELESHASWVDVAVQEQ